jgi:glutathione S-transferase
MPLYVLVEARSHTCPSCTDSATLLVAHRAHITLKELGLPFEEEIIDLSVPRTEEYLKVNPRGLVPSLKYGDEIITESAIVAGFLADAYPSHLVPGTTDPGAALKRARIAFFADTFSTKLNGPFFKSIMSGSEEERDASLKQYVDHVAKEIEPLLSDAAPFFGGSDKLTLAEVLTGPFVLRLLSLPKYDVLPASLLTDLETKAPKFFAWATKVAEHPSVNEIYEPEANAQGFKERQAKAKANV